MTDKLIITKEMLDSENNYIGQDDVSDTNADIEIQSSLGRVKFKSIKTTKSIIALSGSGISAGDGISAGWGISAGGGIKAGDGISAGWGISAGDGISAGWGISAGGGIKAGWGISAGGGIKAGWGIKAGLSITCKGLLKFGFNLFVGTAIRKKVVKGEDTKVECGKLDGNVVYGDVVELGMTNEIETVSENLLGKEITVTIDGKEYTAIIK